MDSSIAIGPLGFQVSVLVAIAAIVLGWIAAALAGRARAGELDAKLYLVLGAGLLVARLAYVLQHGGAYAADPLSVIDIRDGGWSPVAGFIAATLTAAVLALRQRANAWPLALGLVTAAAVWAGSSAVMAWLDNQPTRLPAVTLRSLDGRELALERLQGRPVVLNLWATWCPPCIREMPVLQQAQRDRPDVLFVFVNQGETAQQVQAFLGNRGLALQNVLLDADRRVALEIGARALPTTVFFDADGRMLAARIGELTPAALAARLAMVAPAPADAPRPASSAP